MYFLAEHMLCIMQQSQEYDLQANMSVFHQVSIIFASYLLTSKCNGYQYIHLFIFGRALQGRR